MEDKNTKLYLGECLEVMKDIPTNSIDSIVTDPPYGLKFMGKKWDYDVPSVKVWKEALRVLKPGGHLLSFGGARTYHRMVVNIEDAGFEIRDQIMWIYGTGFPKSLDISKAIDKVAGVKREVVGRMKNTDLRGGSYGTKKDTKAEIEFTVPATPEAKQWDGWGTALKPAHEPICVARKPITEKTIAQNVLKHGTGGINIDECRIATDEKLISGGNLKASPADERSGKSLGMFKEGTKNTFQQNKKGRWPANVIHDGGPEVEEEFAKYGKRGGGFGKRGNSPNWGPASKGGGTMETVGFGDSGSASRFFYAAKASKSERGKGNNHPTVKPLALMRYLVRLVTSPEGVVLDLYMGSGTTGISARREGFRFIGIERDKEYFDIACKRIKHAQLKRSQ